MGALYKFCITITILLFIIIIIVVMVSDLKKDNLQDSGKGEEGKAFHNWQVPGMNYALRDKR